jgi:hypothetical protein
MIRHEDDRGNCDRTRGGWIGSALETGLIAPGSPGAYVQARTLK